jgi:hypothetical protein
MPQPRFMVHSLAQAEAALRAAADCGVAVILESPPNAAQSWGAPYFVKLVDAARAAAPGAQCEAILDCGDAAGVALEALRKGAKIVRLVGKKDVVARVADIARQSDARVETKPRPKAFLDLDGLRAPYEAARRVIAGDKP